MFLYEWFGSSRAAHLVQDVMPCVEVLTCGVLCCFVLFCLVLFVPQGQGIEEWECKSISPDLCPSLNQKFRIVAWYFFKREL